MLDSVCKAEFVNHFLESKPLSSCKNGSFSNLIGFRFCWNCVLETLFYANGITCGLAVKPRRCEIFIVIFSHQNSNLNSRKDTFLNTNSYFNFTSVYYPHSLLNPITYTLKAVNTVLPQILKNVSASAFR
jgi:hypothetical protein